MTPEAKLETKWAVIENVFALLETNERKLTPGEKEVIAGQRIINGILYGALNAILSTFPGDSAPQAIKDARNMLVGLPGLEPPGCDEKKPPTPPTP